MVPVCGVSTGLDLETTLEESFVMRATSIRIGLAAAFAVGALAIAGAASASTLLADFNNHTVPAPGDIYGSWSSGTLTSGATSYNVQASNGFGGQWNDMDPNVDITGETHFELEVTVNVADEVTGLGIVFSMVDEDGTEWLYVINTVDNSWFGLLPGSTYKLTVPVGGATSLVNPGTAGGLDFSNLTGFHLQVDTGGDLDPYDISFENFRAFVPGADLEGDLDGDGFVGIADLNLVLGDWNKNVPPADVRADPSGDNFVGIADLNTVLGNWNAGTPPTAGAAVPEPASLAMLALGGLAATRRRN
jgi:hypothetical protein